MESMKLSELKALIYELSGVVSTTQLKAKYAEIRSLDMRRKASWEQALAIVKKYSQENHSQEFEQWLEHPPEEYQSLFKEIEFVSANYANQLAETQQLSQEMVQLAKDLDELASASQKEADRLKHRKQSAQQIVNPDLN
jgi:chromosome segregation ATPase